MSQRKILNPKRLLLQIHHLLSVGVEGVEVEPNSTLCNRNQQKGREIVLRYHANIDDGLEDRCIDGFDDVGSSISYIGLRQSRDSSR